MSKPIFCKCGHKKSNHENQRDYGRFSGQCKGEHKDGIWYVCGCSMFEAQDTLRGKGNE